MAACLLLALRAHEALRSLVEADAATRGRIENAMPTKMADVCDSGSDAAFCREIPRIVDDFIPIERDLDPAVRAALVRAIESKSTVIRCIAA